MTLLVSFMFFRFEIENLNSRETFTTEVSGFESDAEETGDETGVNKDNILEKVSAIKQGNSVDKWQQLQEL